MQESVHLDGQVDFAGDLCVIWAAFLLFLLNFLLRFCLKHNPLGLGQIYSVFRWLFNFLLTNYCCQFFSAFFCSKITGVGFFNWTSFMRSLARLCCCFCWVDIIATSYRFFYTFSWVNNFCSNNYSVKFGVSVFLHKNCRYQYWWLRLFCAVFTVLLLLLMLCEHYRNSLPNFLHVSLLK